jgi:hypothetical protein
VTLGDGETDAPGGALKLQPLPDEGEPELASFAPALLLNPAEEGRQAAAQSLTDSSIVRQVLGNTVGLRDDLLAPEGGGPALGNSFTASPPAMNANLPEPFGNRAPQGRASAARRGAAPDRAAPEEVTDAATVEDDGPTLRTVMRSIVAVRHADDRSRPRSIAQSVTDATQDVGDGGLDLGERLLDSRMLGDVVQTLVRPNDDPDRGPSFSILGHGRFDFQLDLSGDSGGISVAEQSSGVTASVPFERDISSEANTPRRSAEKINLVDLAIDFVTSATGMSLIIVMGIVLIVVGSFRIVIMLRGE